MDELPRPRPAHTDYFMGLAMAARRRADCRGSRVGAVLAKDDRVISTGYNGTPEDMTNCSDGGCERCANREARFKSGSGYDVCICVHAEQNALLSAARFGISVEGSVAYSTTRPCFGCTKELLQARVRAVHYIHDWAHPNPDLQQQYQLIQARFPEGIRRLQISDPDAAWAMPSLARVPEESGHMEPGAPPDTSPPADQ